MRRVRMMVCMRFIFSLIFPTYPETQVHKDKVLCVNLCFLWVYSCSNFIFCSAIFLCRWVSSGFVFDCGYV
ncbi:hypothetical protein HanRHA438_Chr08g0338701 [Helianthus annuus]|nr:hypothetical protein HanRHA438_Chr08g0338701 [Helianthus annuus]